MLNILTTITKYKLAEKPPATLIATHVERKSFG